MADAQWTIKGREFINCNCSYGCPCQFNGLPTYGNCQAVAGFEIEKGHHGSTQLDGLKFVAIFSWPKAIHEGNGEAAVVVDERATPAQREALLRILKGEDTEPAATVFSVFASTCAKLHEPIVADIEFELDIDSRTARAHISGVVEMLGAPILNPITGAEHRVRIEQPNGFEFAVAEIGRGWSKTTGPLSFELNDTYGQFARIHLNQSGMVR